MKIIFKILLMVFLAMLAGNIHSQIVKDISSTYKWQNVMIGGGGYVTGIAIHPKFPDVVNKWGMIKTKF